jgi:hypothetical protein
MCKRNALLTLASYPELRAALGKASVPDFRGIFLRGYGSQSHAQENGTTVGVTSTMHASGSLGTVQGDAGRNINGDVTLFKARVIAADGAFAVGAVSGQAMGEWDTTGTINFLFDISRIVPTATENRPVNTAVRYLIRALP